MEVSAADHTGDLDAQGVRLGDLSCDPLDGAGIDSVGEPGIGERLARKLEEHPLIHPPSPQSSPTARRANRLTPTFSPIWAPSCRTRSPMVPSNLSGLTKACSYRTPSC